MKLRSYGEMTPDPPKKVKEKKCFQMQFRPFPVFQAYSIFSGKLADLNLLPLLVEMSTFLNLPSSLIWFKIVSYNNICHFWAIFVSARVKQNIHPWVQFKYNQFSKTLYKKGD